MEIMKEITKDIYEYIMSGYAEGIDVLHLLTLLLFTPEQDYVRLALRLFTDLLFPLEDYELILERVQRFEGLYPEAELLIRKVQKMRLDQDVVDEYMEDEEEGEDDWDEEEEGEDDWDEEEEGEDDRDEHEWMSDDDSGYGSDSEELMEERFQEEQERIQKLESSVHKLFAEVIAWGIRSGNAERIAYSIELLDGFDLPLLIFQQYGIAELIEEYGSHSEEALHLLHQIQEMAELEQGAGLQ